MKFAQMVLFGSLIVACLAPFFMIAAVTLYEAATVVTKIANAAAGVN